MSTTSLARPVGDQPKLADFTAEASWEGSLSTRVSARQFAFVVAEPPALGGTDEAPNPIEYLLGSLNGCVSVVVETVAKELEIPVTALETHATGTIDLRGFLGTADVSPHFQQLTLTLTLTTPVPESELDELKAQVLRRCPLFNLIKDAGVDLRGVWVLRQG